MLSFWWIESILPKGFRRPSDHDRFSWRTIMLVVNLISIRFRFTGYFTGYKSTYKLIVYSFPYFESGSTSFCVKYINISNLIRNVHLRRSIWPKSLDLYSNKVVLVRILRALLIKCPYEGRTRSLKGQTAFSGPARTIAYGPHRGIFSIVLQWKRAQGRTGHIIIFRMLLLVFVRIYFRITNKFKDWIESIFVVLHYIQNLRIALNQCSWYCIACKI